MSTPVPARNEDPLLTLDEAAGYVGGVSRTFLRKEIAAGRLEATHLGRLIRVRRSALERYLATATTTDTHH